MHIGAMFDMGGAMGSVDSMMDMVYRGVIDPDLLILISAVSLIFGLLQCFLGYKITKIMYAILGFVLGWVLTFLVGGTMMLSPDSGSGSVHPALFILIGLVLSILLAFLMFKIYLVGVFISQFFLSFAVFTAVLAALMKQMNGAVAALSLVLALVVAIVSVILVRPVIIICTAWSGGIAAGNALAMMLRLEDPIGLLLGIVLAIGGMVVQFMTTKKPVAAPAAAPAYGYPPPPVPAWQTPPQPPVQPVQQPAPPVYQAPQQPVTPVAPAPAPEKPAAPVPEETVMTPPPAAETVMTAAPQAPAEGGWTCSCGRVNHYQFCEDCGKPRPQ